MGPGKNKIAWPEVSETNVSMEEFGNVSKMRQSMRSGLAASEIRKSADK